MEIKEHGEYFQVKLDAGEEVSITVGAITKSWTVATNKTAIFKVRFDEQIEETPA